MPSVYNEDANIYYDVFGEKNGREAVVLLPGAGSDHNIWFNQIDYLKKRYYVIAIDNRGSGKSDAPEYKYSADLLASDVEKVVHEEGLSQILLAGFSMGGLIAQKFTAKNPSLVKKLALLNCSLGAGNEEIVLPNPEVVNMFLFAACLTPLDCARNAMDYNFGENFENERPDLYKKYFNETLKNADGITNQVAVMVSSEKLIVDYTALTMPLLCIYSNEDPVIPPENGDVVKKYLPHAKVNYLSGYHASMLIHPETVNKMLDDFFKK